MVTAVVSAPITSGPGPRCASHASVDLFASQRDEEYVEDDMEEQVEIS